MREKDSKREKANRSAANRSKGMMHVFSHLCKLTNPHKRVFMHMLSTSADVFCVGRLWQFFWIHQAAQKVAQSSSLWLPQPKHDPSSQVHWPGSYVHSGQPFPDSIKEAAELRETEDKNGKAGSLTTSTMTTTVSKSCPAFWRGQPLKIWEPHSQLLTATGLQAESKKHL